MHQVIVKPNPNGKNTQEGIAGAQMIRKQILDPLPLRILRGITLAEGLVLDFVDNLVDHAHDQVVEVDAVDGIGKVALEFRDGHRRRQRWRREPVKGVQVRHESSEHVVRPAGLDDLPTSGTQKSLGDVASAAPAVPVQRVAAVGSSLQEPDQGGVPRRGPAGDDQAVLVKDT